MDIKNIEEFWESSGDKNSKKRFNELIEAFKGEAPVPFIGAGMSIIDVSKNIYPTWVSFLDEIANDYMEEEFKEEYKELKDDKKYEELASFLQKKEVVGKTLFDEQVKSIFSKEKLEGIKFPRKLLILPKLFKKQIVTTNLDQVLESVFGEEYEVVLPSMSESTYKAIMDSKSCILKLHGDIDEESSWVLTKEQYDKRYNNREESFVANLGKLIGSKRLLFLGCSLEQDRTLEIVNIISQMAQNQYSKHYAFLEDMGKENRKKREKYLVNEMHIYPIWFEKGKYESIEVLLEEIKKK